MIKIKHTNVKDQDPTHLLSLGREIIDIKIDDTFYRKAQTFNSTIDSCSVRPQLSWYEHAHRIIMTILH